MTYLKVRQVRSAIGCDERQRSTLRGLGLRHPGSERVLENTPAVRGMVKAVIHLVSVEEASEGGTNGK